MNKNTTEKKNYSKPGMRVVKLKQRTSLLSGSDAADGVGYGYNSSSEEIYRA